MNSTYIEKAHVSLSIQQNSLNDVIWEIYFKIDLKPVHKFMLIIPMLYFLIAL